MTVTDLDKVDAIGVKDGKLRLMIIDYIDWEFEDMHLDVLQDKINNYLAYLTNKQYLNEYGDDFQQKVIDIHFQHGISENCVIFLNAVSNQLSDTDIVINIHLPGE